MDQNLSTIIAAGIPTLAVIVAIVRNESAISGLTSRIASLETRLDSRIETLDRDLREWARITMQLNTDVAKGQGRFGLNCDGLL
jgi:hypothetical protein